MKRYIDVEWAVRLFAELGSWKRVADAMRPVEGPAYAPGSLSVAAARWRVEQGIQPRHYTRLKKTKGDGGLGIMWRPLAPKPLKVVPDYRTNTVHR